MNDSDGRVDGYVAAVLKRIPRAFPDRARIADDVRTHIMERLEAGESVGDAVERMGPPEEVARAYLQEMHLPLASLTRRAGAFLIDLLLGVALVVPALAIALGVLIGPFWREEGALPAWWIVPGVLIVLGLASMLLAVVYFPPLEARYGQTLGKRVLGLCVTTESGEQIGWGAAIVRRLPVFLEFFWFDALFALFTRRKQRAFDLIAKTLVVRCAVLLAVLATPAVAQTRGGPAPLPPPGRLVDLGGWRVHLHCTGASDPSRPTVVLEAGAGDFSVEWSLVQPGVSEFARVCSYDRAGQGWSELGPRPRSWRQIVYELHTLLERGGERAPFVLVGHSMGGWLVRTYAATYPTEVAGMVLLDAGRDDPVRLTADGTARRSSQLVTGRPIPPALTSGPLRESDIPPGMWSMVEAQAVEFGRTANEGPRAKLPADAQRMRSWSLGQVRHHIVNDNPHEADELAVLRAQRERSEHPYGEMPVAVVSAGLTDRGTVDTSERAREHAAEQAALAKLSRTGRHLIATRSGHHVHLDEPELVVRVIAEVVAAARR